LEFLPIAIQLFQDPDPSINPIYTPEDPPADWLFAKLLVANCDFGYFQGISHWARAHMLTEPIIIASNRMLALNHPVHKLLKPHFKYHLGINALGRRSLFTPTGMVPKIASATYDSTVDAILHEYGRWTYEDQALPTWLAKRKIPEKEYLPEYYYRDDGMVLWNSIDRFVRKILSLYYKGDSDVQNDHELQDWAQDVVTNGYNGDASKFPTKITSYEQLTRLCTIFIFNGAVHHTVVNFPQWESFAFVPASPSTILRPPPGFDKQPVKKGQLTMHDIFKALPTQDICAFHIVQMYIITQYSSADEWIGVYSEYRFVDEEAQKAKKEFQEELRKLGEEIDKRGWDHMHPKKMPSSVAT